MLVTDTSSNMAEKLPPVQDTGPIEVHDELVERQTSKVEKDSISSMEKIQKSDSIFASSSKCYANEQMIIAREFMLELSKEKQQRQCTLIELWHNCSQCTLGEKLAIFGDWIYANVNAKIALFGTSTVVPLCAWFTKVFWEALISQLIFIIFVWMFARYVFCPQTTTPLCEAEKFDRQLYQQSQSHMLKMSKIKNKLEINSQVISPSTDSADEEPDVDVKV